MTSVGSFCKSKHIAHLYNGCSPTNDKKYNLIFPNFSLQKNSVNKAIKLVKMGKVKNANKIIKPAIDFLIKKKCKKIILGCTELPIAIFAFKSFKTIKNSKIFLDPNLILAHSAMKKYNK